MLDPNLEFLPTVDFVLTHLMMPDSQKTEHIYCSVPFILTAFSAAPITDSY